MSDYDAIIIGSGAGGAAAAYRLVLEGLKVLMLEKGPPLPRDGSTLDNTAVVTLGRFLSKEPWVDGRGKTICPQEHFNLGGKTKWYGAAVIRYSPEEFAPDAAYSARGWPISHADLEPYYEEAERLLGVRTFPCEPGLRRILERVHAADDAWTSVPLPMALSPDISRDPVEARHFDGFASVANLKGDAETSFLRLLAGRPNFTLRTSAEVRDLLPAQDADTAGVAGVRLVDGEELYARVTLLAAGALASPRLLQRFISQLGPAYAPPLRAVGRNLKKHVLTAMVAVSFARQNDLLRKTMLTTHRGHPHSSVQPLGFDADLIATLIPKFVPRFLARIVGRHAYGFFLQTEDGSHPDNRVVETIDTASRPAASQSPASQSAASQSAPTRIMDYDALRTPASQREHTSFTRAFQRALNNAGMISFTQRVGLDGTAHVDGTLAAGTTADDAVVDAAGAVFGIPGLYVVDGSILPRSSRVNPSLSIYAWGLRAGALLAASLRPGGG
jgi:choline dehydrogenase-like flavoprotein